MEPSEVHPFVDRLVRRTWFFRKNLTS